MCSPAELYLPCACEASARYQSTPTGRCLTGPETQVSSQVLTEPVSEVGLSPGRRKLAAEVAQSRHMLRPPKPRLWPAWFSELMQHWFARPTAVQVFARAPQDAVRHRDQAQNKLRSLLRYDRPRC
jgi:hypothetical protein